ncbi:MAG: hypothetical protein WC524_05575 [Candidatus Aminicenantales bacterium]
MKKSSWLDNIPEGRLISLDVYRGLVMLLLIAEVTGIYDLMVSPSLQGTALYAIGLQFHHHPWHGLRLWDLGQGLFMFISGIALTFSYNKRWSQGASQKKCFWQAVQRALFLFLIGWALYIIYPPEGATSWSFLLDILPMLAVGSLVAFLVLRWPSRWQLAFSGGLLLLTELLYRLWPVSGFNQPFVKGHNFGSYLDIKLWGSSSPEGWVTFNMIPATAYIIWGVIAGNIIRSQIPSARKLRVLSLAGLAGVIAGLALDPVTPVIKKISTSSFMLLSGGFCFLFLALSYFIVDLSGKRGRWAFVPVAIGMNPLFIFVFARSGGADWFMNVVRPFSWAILGWAGSGAAETGTALGCLVLMCGLCLALFKNRIFLKI